MNKYFFINFNFNREFCSGNRRIFIGHFRNEVSVQQFQVDVRISARLSRQGQNRLLDPRPSQGLQNEHIIFNMFL